MAENETQIPESEKFFDFTDSEGKVYKVRPDVVTKREVAEMAPPLASRPRLLDRLFRFLMMDRVNEVHGRYAHTPGIPFSHALIEDEFKINIKIDNEEVLERFREGAFVTVSNHPYGSVDGILLLHIVGKHREDYKVMVNMFLNHLSAMRPNFIAVDALASDDPEKRAVSMEGIREALKRVKSGHPVGFFPAGAVSKIQKNLRIEDREWQGSIIRLIKKMKVPVVPIYFHGHNSTLFNILGLISWKIRTLRLPAEVFDKQGKTIRVSIGEPVSVECQNECATEEELSALLRDATYSLRKKK